MLLGGKKSLGLDIGADSIKLVQVVNGKGKQHIEKWAYLDQGRSSIDGLRWRSGLFDELKLALQVNSIRRGNISVSIPDSRVTLSYRKIPPMPDAEIADALRWEAAKDVNFQVDEIAMDYISLGEVVDGNDLMQAFLVCVSRKKLVEELHLRLTDGGLKVRSVEFSALAQVTSYLRSAPGGGVVAIVDMGQEQTNLVILKDGDVRFFRAFETGGSHVTRAISQATGLGLSEARDMKHVGLSHVMADDPELSRALRGTLEGMVDEVFHTFHFYNAERREGAVEKVLIAGGGGCMPGIDGFFQEILGIPTELLDPFVSCPPSEGLRDREKLLGLGPRMATAVGLAMDE